MTSLSWFVALESVISGGLVALLWLLYARLGRQPFFKWWAWAWTAFALYLTLGLQSMPPTGDRNVGRHVLLGLATLCGHLQPAMLLLGALSLRPETSPSRRWRRGLLALAAATALVSLAVSAQLTRPIDGLTLRLAIRAWALVAAAAVTTWLFMRRGRTNGSVASYGAALACALYGLTQAAYGVAATGHLAAGQAAPLSAIFAPEGTARMQLFLLDISTSYGLVLALVFLLIEEFHQSAQQLAQSVRLRQDVLEVNAALEAEVAERRRGEQALRLSEARFAAAFRTNPCSVAITRRSDGRIVEVNDACEYQTGYARHEVIGRCVSDLHLWVDPAARDAVVADLDAGARIRNREVRWRAKSGDELTILYSADRITMDGEACILSVAMDITEHKRVEARHRAILRAVPDWIFLTTNTGVFLDAHINDRRHLLAPPEKFLGRRYHDILPPALADDLLRLVQRVAAADEAGALEYSIEIDGTLRHYEVRAVRCDTDKVLTIVRDVTLTRRAERQAQELQGELARIGRVTTLAALAGSLAHELSQPLAALRTTAQAALRLVQRPVPDLPELGSALTDIVDDSRRATDVIDRVRSLLLKEDVRREPIDLNEAVAKVLGVVRGDLAIKGIQLDTQFDHGLPLLVGDRVQLQQLALNLILNACEAVETRAPGSRRVSILTASDGGTVKLEVHDSGEGLPPEQLARVFEPFYSTKPAGMGLGLWICEMIVHGHEGRIDVERSSAGGLTVVCRLPLPAADGHPAAGAHLPGIPQRDAASAPAGVPAPSSMRTHERTRP